MVCEGTDIVRQTKIQNLAIAFETIRMKDSETFDEFNSKLSHIVNLSFNLGEPIPDHKVVKKTLRSLPKRFHLKVVAIKEHTNFNQLTVDELVGNIQTFEANHCSNKKSKCIALMSYKSAKDCSNDGSDGASDDADFECVFVKRFKIKKNDILENKAYKKYEKNPIHCYECQGFDHVASPCENRKLKNKGKALSATWSDDSSIDLDSSKSDSEEPKCVVLWLELTSLLCRARLTRIQSQMRI